MSYTIKHDTGSDTKTIFDPAGWELITIQELNEELNELLARAQSAEKLCDYWEARAKAANQLDKLISQNHKLRQACAAALCADDKGCLTVREARRLCLQALKEVAE